jgi:hypothetical protein
MLFVVFLLLPALPSQAPQRAFDLLKLNRLGRMI